MQDERGYGERREQWPHILKNERPQYRGDLIGSGAEAFGPCPPRTEGFVAGLARRDDIGRCPCAPRLGHGSPSFQALGWQSPRGVVLPHEIGKGIDEHQSLDAFGMMGRIADRGRTAQARSEEYDPLTPNGIEHGRHVGIADRFDHMSRTSPPEAPTPLKSAITTRLKPPRRFANRTNLGSSQNRSIGMPIPGRNKRSGAPLPLTWYAMLTPSGAFAYLVTGRSSTPSPSTPVTLTRLDETRRPQPGCAPNQGGVLQGQQATLATASKRAYLTETTRPEPRSRASEFCTEDRASSGGSQRPICIARPLDRDPVEPTA